MLTRYLRKRVKMREALISLFTILAVATTIKASDVGKDGFNYYKDYLRGRSDEALSDEQENGERVYFYRTPIQLYPGLLPALEQEYRKRTGNAYKNHMLSKETWSAAGGAGKRSSKTALAYMMEGGKHPYNPAGNYCPYGK